MSVKRMLFVVLAVVMVTSFIAPCYAGGSSSRGTQATTAGGIPVQTTPLKYFQRTRAGYDAPDNPKVLAFIEARTGIKIELTPISNDNFQERIDLMIAAGEEVDGINIIGYADTYVRLRERNVIIPLNNLLDQYGPNIKRVMADGLYTCTDIEGQIWALPRAERFPEGFVTTIRGDWLQALGMSMPTTMAELDAYLAAVKTRDLNGNGNPNDEIPYLPTSLTYGMSNFFPYYLRVKDGNMTSTGFGSNHRYMDDAGVIRPIFSHPDLINVVTKFNEWYSRGYMPQDIHLLQTAQLDAIRTQGLFGLQGGWYLDGSGNLVDWSDANPGRPKAWTDPLPPLRNAPSGRSVWPSNPKYGPQMVFFRTGKNTVHLMRYFDWICSDPVNNVIVNFGLENDHWSWNSDRSAVVVTAEGQARYNEFFAMSNTYWAGLMPRITTSANNPKQLAMYDLMDKIRGFRASNYPFDSHIPYSTRGTDAEFLTADGSTLMQEAVIRMIIGQQPLSEWPRIQTQYNNIEGNILSRVWTEQYYRTIGQPAPRL